MEIFPDNTNRNVHLDKMTRLRGESDEEKLRWGCILLGRHPENEARQELNMTSSSSTT